MSDPAVNYPLSSLPTQIRTVYLERYNSYKANLTNLEAQYDKLVASNAQSYTFEGGDGRQSVNRRKLKEIEDAIDRCERKIVFYHNKLYGRGLMTINLRRKP